MAWIMASIGYGFWGVLLAAAAISLVPLSLLGTLSPIAIRLLIRSTAESGKVAGCLRDFHVGNVVGVLMTTLLLIPRSGLGKLHTCSRRCGRVRHRSLCHVKSGAAE